MITIIISLLKIRRKTLQLSSKGGSVINKIKGFFSSAISPLIENGYDGFDWRPTSVNTLEAMANNLVPDAYQAYTLGKIVAGNTLLGCIRGIVAAKSEIVIEINNIEDFMKIGSDTNYPSDGYYKLTSSFNASNLENTIANFKGILDGQGYTI